MKPIGLVIGHSESSQGCVNKTHRVTEYQFNCDLVRLVQDELCKLGFNPIVFFRKNGLEELVKEINKVEPSIVISFHCNAFNTFVSGSEVLYYSTSSKGKRLASLLLECIVDTLALRNRGLLPRVEGRGSYIIKNVKAPAALIEPFFLDNDSDYKIALEKLDELATAIANSIAKYFSQCD